MGLTIDGLSSGLDTTAIIKALMDVQSIPRTQLGARIDDTKGVIAQLQSLNASLQSLATQAGAAASPTASARFTATSSSPAVSVVAGASAAPVSADIVVDRIARAHTVVTAAFSAWPDDPPVLTVEDAAGARTVITAASTSPQDVARAISSAAVGVTAAAVPAGTAADGTALFRLQLTADRTGDAGRFVVWRGDATAGPAVDVAAEPGAAVIATGADAQVRLWAGTPAEQAVTSSTNTFTGLFPGVDVTLAQASPNPVTITVAPDLAARTQTAADLVGQIGTVLTRIANGSKATVADAAGGTTTLGVFTGESTVRSLRGALADAVQHPVGGVSPSTIGITIDRYGALSFDREKFAAAMAADPDATTALFGGVAARVAQTATTYADRYDGLLTARIEGRQHEVTALGDQLQQWDVRLAQRRATLERTYAHLETMLSQLQSQSSYLASQLASLPTSQNGSGS